MQKIINDKFVQNDIVRFLLEKAGVNLSQLECMDFDNEDQAQFAQLIGFSMDGYAELDYVSDMSYRVASKLSEAPDLLELQAINKVLLEKVRKFESVLKSAVHACEVFDSNE